MWQTLSGRLATHCGGWTGCEAGCQRQPSWSEVWAAVGGKKKKNPKQKGAAVMDIRFGLDVEYISMTMTRRQ